VFISKSNAAIRLGTATVYMRELWERESAIVESSGKLPVIEQKVRVEALSPSGHAPIVVGQLNIKMKMRKPITQAAKFFREKQEMEELNRVADPRLGHFGGRKRHVTIHVVGCIDLRSSQSQAEMAPFFYYQFYNFDERYSQTVRGASAIFDDMQPYEVTHD